MTTIKEIARRANVSIGTVDRVLHNRGRVSKETKEKVRRIIEQLDYRPNIFARNLKLSKAFSFGVLMPNPSQDSKYWELPIKGITKAQNELLAHKVRITYFHYDKYSENSFKRASNAAFKANLDGLLLAPVVSEVFDKFVQEIPDHLPYIFFDSFVPNANYVSYIGQDSFQSGVLAGRLMEILVKEKATIAVIKFLPRDYHIDDRASGFLSYLGENSKISPKTYEVDSSGSIEYCQQITESIINDNQNLCGIYVTNANTHPIAECIKSKSLAGKIHIIGYDLIEENIRYLKEGVIDFLISQMSEKQGYEGVFALYKHVVLKETVNKRMRMQLDIITKENVDYYQS
ncbi:MAG: substrate-binding domain-containing protein [Calditrichaeota bacterium]|nr:substrate-binding domain-containing protein [Calditrichota bacterium]